MNNQKRTIIGACDYSIATFQQLKKDMTDIGAANHELTWAIGSIVITLASQLIRICGHVFDEAAQSGEANAAQDLTEIKKRFNDVVAQMVNT